MTSPNPAPVQEAREAGFADWYVLQDADQVDAHAGWDAGWAAALAWAAPMIDKIHNCGVEGDCPYCAKLASLLRQEGGAT